MALNPKQKRFVEEYLIDLNAMAAAARAGYSPKTSHTQGSRLLARPEVAEAIAKAQVKRGKRTEITQDRVLEELAKVGFASMGDYLRVTPDGDPAIDLSEMTSEQASVLCEATVEDFTEGRGENARDVRRVKIKLHDKLSALEKIGKHLGMFPNRHELTGKNGGPIAQTHTTKSAEELAEEARRLGFDPVVLGLGTTEETGN